MSHAMGGRPGRPRPTRDTYQPFLVKLKLKLQCYHFCLYGGLRRYNPERLRSHGHGHGRASGTPTPCSRRTPTAFGKAQLSTAPTRHRIPGWSDEVTCLAYLRVRVLCQPTLRPLGMAVSSHNPKICIVIDIESLDLHLDCVLQLINYIGPWDWDWKGGRDNVTFNNNTE